MIDEDNYYEIHFAKPIYQIAAQMYDEETTKSENQLKFTKKCTNLSDELSQTIFTGDIPRAYDAINQILELDTSSYCFPYETFNSNWVPKLLSVFIHDHPNTSLFSASLKLLEILTRGKCIEQLFNESFLTDLMNFVYGNVDDDLISSAISCIRNIINHSRNGAICGYKQMIKGLTKLLEHDLKPNVLENVFYCLSGYLKYSDLFDEESIMNLIRNLMLFFKVDIQEYQVHGLYCLYLILEHWENYSDVILTKDNISLLFNYINIQDYENLKITCILFLTKIFKLKNNEQIKYYTIQFIDCNWLGNIWNQTNYEIHLYLYELLMSLFNYNQQLLNSAISNGIFDLFMKELSLSKFNHRKNIIQFLLSLAYYNTNIIHYLISKNFIAITKEFIETDCNIEKPIFRFYLIYFNLIISNIITNYSPTEIEEINEILLEKMENPKLSDYVNELQKKIAIILDQ